MVEKLIASVSGVHGRVRARSALPVAQVHDRLPAQAHHERAAARAVAEQALERRWHRRERSQGLATMVRKMKPCAEITRSQPGRHEPRAL